MLKYKVLGSVSVVVTEPSLPRRTEEFVEAYFRYRSTQLFFRPLLDRFTVKELHCNSSILRAQPSLYRVSYQPGNMV